MNKTVHQLRKEGKLNEAWQTAVSMRKNNPADRRAELELAWVYYDFLKREAGNGNYRNFLRVCRQLSEISLENNDDMLREQLSWAFFRMLRKIVDDKLAGFETIAEMTNMYVSIIGLEKPSLPQSLLLKTLLKTKTLEGPFWLLLPWMNSDMLRNEDLVAEVYENKKIIPLAERIFYAYAKSLIAEARSGSRKALNGIRDLIRHSETGDQKNKYSFADYYLAEANHLAGNNDKAVQYAETFAQNNHQKNWAWALLAKLTGDSEKQLSFLAMAISLQRKETFLLQVREAIIPCLLDRGYQFAAAQNVKIIKGTRIENDWPVPARIDKYTNESWFENPDDTEDINDIVRKEAAKAMDYLFAGAAKTPALVTGKHGNYTDLFTIDGYEMKYKTKHRLKPGDWLEILIHEGKILNHTKIIPPGLNGNIRKYKGTIRLQSNFGFVDNVFVAPYLIETLKLNGNAECEGIAIFATDRKKNRKGWKAVSATIATN
jgi:hypothetical protein